MILERVRRAVGFAAKRRRPELRETLGAQSSMTSSLSSLAPYNPDDLITRKGSAIYDRMQTDAQVAACLNVKKFAVLSRGWEVHPLSDSREDTEAADFVRFCLLDMRGSVLDALYKALDAVAKGFSVCEINYKVIESGPYKGMIGLESVKSKDPSTLGFELDQYLNVTGVTRLPLGGSPERLAPDP